MIKEISYNAWAQDFESLITEQRPAAWEALADSDKENIILATYSLNQRIRKFGVNSAVELVVQMGEKLAKKALKPAQ